MADHEIISTAYISNALIRLGDNYKSGKWRTHQAYFLDMRRDIGIVINAAADPNRYFITDEEMEGVTIIINHYTDFISGVNSFQQ